MLRLRAEALTSQSNSRIRGTFELVACEKDLETFGGVKEASSLRLSKCRPLAAEWCPVYFLQDRERNCSNASRSSRRGWRFGEDEEWNTVLASQDAFVR